jgi:probable HAF family extracellular repeat protein
MKFENTPLFVSCATQTPSSAGQEKEFHNNNGNVGGRLFLTVLVLLVNTARLQAQIYAITDLGALPGNSASKAYGLNNLGQAVGISDSGAAIATLFSNGTATNMNTLNANVSVATCISGSSQAAGYNIFYSNPNTTFRAFLYGNGAMTDIQSDSLFPSGTLAHGINSSGTVVGQGWVNSSSFHAFMYARGTMVDLGTFPGGIQAAASAINDVGQVVGTSDGAIAVSKKTTEHFSHAFLYAYGKMVDLGIPSGATYSQGTAITGTARSSVSLGSAMAAMLFFTVTASGPIWASFLVLLRLKQLESISLPRSWAPLSSPSKVTIRPFRESTSRLSSAMARSSILTR